MINEDIRYVGADESGSFTLFILQPTKALTLFEGFLTGT
jgi:hypothetical protein